MGILHPGYQQRTPHNTATHTTYDLNGTKTQPRGKRPALDPTHRTGTGPKVVSASAPGTWAVRTPETEEKGKKGGEGTEWSEGV
eukprot:scaffold55679_cov38-Tisochrysis_lutea.AAC.11